MFFFKSSCLSLAVDGVTYIYFLFSRRKHRTSFVPEKRVQCISILRIYVWPLPLTVPLLLTNQGRVGSEQDVCAWAGLYHGLPGGFILCRHAGRGGRPGAVFARAYCPLARITAMACSNFSLTMPLKEVDRHRLE